MTHRSFRFIAAFLIMATIPAGVVIAEDEFHLGLKVGPNVSFASGETTLSITGVNAGVGFTGGVFAEYDPIPNLAIEFNIFFASFDYGLDFSGAPNNLDFAYAAIEFPLQVKGRLKLGNGFGFLGAGADFIILVGGVEVTRDGSTNTQTPDRVFFPSLVVSGGYDLTLENVRLTFELRYVRTFSPVVDDPAVRMFVNRFDLLFGFGKTF